MGVSASNLNCSLNEVESVAKRAAAGAGYPWGLAEESAKAVRWLCENSLDGCSELAELLQSGLARTPKDHVPNPSEQYWRGIDSLCPLATGAMLSDHAFRIRSGPVTLLDIQTPLLILPFASMLSRQLKANVTLSCSDSSEMHAVTGPETAEISETFARNRASLVLKIGGGISNPLRKSSRAMPDKNTWDRLNRYASLTYAPATDQSREQGAGAGLTDND